MVQLGGKVSVALCMAMVRLRNACEFQGGADGEDWDVENEYADGSRLKRARLGKLYHLVRALSWSEFQCGLRRVGAPLLNLQWWFFIPFSGWRMRELIPRRCLNYWWELYWIQHCAWASESSLLLLTPPIPCSAVPGFPHSTWNQVFGVELGLLEEETHLHLVHRGCPECLKPCQMWLGKGNPYFSN